MSGEGEDKGTSVMTLSTAPTEYAKSIARLMQAALLFSMSALKQGSLTMAALADVNDLSFHRDGGRVDLSAAILGDITGDRVRDLLLDAAIAFADAHASEHDVKPLVEGPEAG